jgi:hypothetical protein
MISKLQLKRKETLPHNACHNGISKKKNATYLLEQGGQNASSLFDEVCSVL